MKRVCAHHITLYSTHSKSTFSRSSNSKWHETTIGLRVQNHSVPLKNKEKKSRRKTLHIDERMENSFERNWCTWKCFFFFFAFIRNGKRRTAVGHNKMNGNEWRETKNDFFDGAKSNCRVLKRIGELRAQKLGLGRILTENTAQKKRKQWKKILRLVTSNYHFGNFRIA